MAVFVGDPFTEIRVAVQCVEYAVKEAAFLDKKHLILGAIICCVDYVLSCRTR